MTPWQAVILGFVQGLTEFLPISSSAHLIIVPWLFRWPEPGLAFNVALHLGTLAAVLAYFWRDIATVAVEWVRALGRRDPVGTPAARLGWAVLVGSVPTGVLGVLTNDAVDAFFHSGGGGDQAMVLIALLLIALGLLLWTAERRGARRRRLDSVGLGDGLIVGIAQAFALLPGVSRSGSTITASLFLGMERASAARFSFLLGIPAIAGAGLLETLHLLRAGMPPEERLVFAVGMASAALAGFLAIAFLLQFLQRYSTRLFVAYRIVLGGLLLLWILLAR